jgi:hypothetical protein
MKHRFSWILGGSCLLLIAIVLILRNATESVPEKAVNSSSAATAIKPTEPTKSSLPETRPEQPEKHEVLTAPPATQEGILGQIEDASVTYDAKALPLIEPYLLNPDPVVREAAKNGMINLGDAAAGPLLREASRHAPTPQEAVALSEAADYVELPPATAHRIKRSTEDPIGTSAPSTTKRKPGHHGTKNPEQPVVPATE